MKLFERHKAFHQFQDLFMIETLNKTVKIH